MAKGKKAEVPAKTENKEPLVKVQRDQYQKGKTASGGASLNNGDVVAVGLQGLTLEELYQVADQFEVAKPAKGDKPAEDLEKKYAHLNPGMQRMNLGNRIRGKISQVDKANAKAITDAKDDEKALARAQKRKSGEDKLLAILKPFTQAVAEREKAAAKAKADAEKAAKAKEKDAA